MPRILPTNPPQKDPHTAPRAGSGIRSCPIIAPIVVNTSEKTLPVIALSYGKDIINKYNIQIQSHKIFDTINNQFSGLEEAKTPVKLKAVQHESTAYPQSYYSAYKRTDKSKSYMACIESS